MWKSWRRKVILSLGWSWSDFFVKGSNKGGRLFYELAVHTRVETV